MRSLAIKQVDIPDGEYEATWSGYRLEIYADNKTIKTETTIGVRGINLHIKVKVSGGLVEKINNEETDRSSQF